MAEHKGNKEKTHLIWLFSLLSLFPLLTFKIYIFINENLTSGLEQIGLHLAMPGLNWAIPVGVSFFTFQAYEINYIFNNKIIRMWLQLQTRKLYRCLIPEHVIHTATIIIKECSGIPIS